jgi:hypothetical protein
MEDDLRHLLAQGVDPHQLERHVKTRGFQSLEQDAFVKAGMGLIPPEEIVRLGFGVAQAVEPD